jgi:hypothetical protein
MVNQVILNNKGTQGGILVNIQVNNKVIPASSQVNNKGFPASSMEVRIAFFSCWLLPFPCDFIQSELLLFIFWHVLHL